MYNEERDEISLHNHINKHSESLKPLTLDYELLGFADFKLWLHRTKLEILNLLIINANLVIFHTEKWVNLHLVETISVFLLLFYTIKVCKYI